MLLGASERPFRFVLSRENARRRIRARSGWVLARAAPRRQNRRLDVSPSQFPRCRSVVYCRGSVRRPVRPFVIEFKPRSSKSSAPRPRIDEAAPAFLDVGVFTANRSVQGDSYEIRDEGGRRHLRSKRRPRGRTDRYAQRADRQGFAVPDRKRRRARGCFNGDRGETPSRSDREQSRDGSPRSGQVSGAAEGAGRSAGKRRATGFRETRGDRLAARNTNRRRTQSRAQIPPKASSSRRGTKSRREVEAALVQGRAVKIAADRSPSR